MCDLIDFCTLYLHSNANQITSDGVPRRRIHHLFLNLCTIGRPESDCVSMWVRIQEHGEALTHYIPAEESYLASHSAFLLIFEIIDGILAFVALKLLQKHIILVLCGLLFNDDLRFGAV